MKKIFKYSLLLMASVVALVACKDDDTTSAGEWNATADYADVYFPIDKQVLELDPKDPTTASITVARRNKVGALTVEFDKLVNTDEIFTITPAVFADGDSVAKMNVSFPKAVVGTTYNLQLTTTDPRFVSAYSDSLIYNMSVTRVKWNPAGYMVVTPSDLTWLAANDDAGADVRPLYVEDESGNVVPITNYSVGDTIKGWVRYTDDFITGIFSVTNVTYPVKFQQRDDKPGVYRIVNAYGTNYYYNNSGDYDAANNYYMILHMEDPTHVWMEFDQSSCDMGMTWSYGAFKLRSLSGTYGSNPNGAAPYCGTYENGVVTFPAQSFYLAMSDHNGGAWSFYGNPAGAFRLVLDPNLDLYVTNIETDFDYSDVFAGVYTSGKTGSGSATLQVGALKEDIATMLEAGKVVPIVGTPYRIVEPYAEGYDLYFGLDKDGKIYVPEGYRLQPTGLDDGMGHDIYAKIDPSMSTFTEKEVLLTITFVSKDESINYGTTKESVANITWTKIAVGTYYYTMFSSNKDGSPEADPGYELYKRDDRDDVYKIGDWLMGTDFMFTWDKTTNACEVLEQEIGYEHPDYGMMYIIEGANYTSKYAENTSYYDPATKIFHFFPAYFVEDGSFGQVEELFEITEESAVKHQAPRSFGNAKLNKAIKRANRWQGQKTQPFAKFRSIRTDAKMIH